MAVGPNRRLRGQGGDLAADACADGRRRRGRVAPTGPGCSRMRTPWPRASLRGRADRVLGGRVVALTGRAFHQPAGWAFLGLSAPSRGAGFTDEYAALALASRDRRYPTGALVATFGDSSWLWWFVFIALGLQFTAAIRPAPHARRLLPWATVVSRSWRRSGRAPACDSAGEPPGDRQSLGSRGPRAGHGDARFVGDHGARAVPAGLGLRPRRGLPPIAGRGPAAAALAGRGRDAAWRRAWSPPSRSSYAGSTTLPGDLHDRRHHHAGPRGRAVRGEVPAVRRRAGRQRVRRRTRCRPAR